MKGCLSHDSPARLVPVPITFVSTCLYEPFLSVCTLYASPGPVYVAEYGQSLPRTLTIPPAIGVYWLILDLPHLKPFVRRRRARKFGVHIRFSQLLDK